MHSATIFGRAAFCQAAGIYRAAILPPKPGATNAGAFGAGVISDFRQVLWGITKGVCVQGGTRRGRYNANRSGRQSMLRHEPSGKSGVWTV